MDYITLLTTAFFVGLSGAMMPGPMLTVTVSETPKRGFWVGPQIVLGHGLVEAALIACLAGGLSHYIQQPVVTGGIGLVGGLVLLWFGYGIYSEARQGNASLELAAAGESGSEGNSRNVFSPVLSGIVLSLTNPYWSLWWATVGAGYVVVAMSLGAAGVLLFFTGHILSDFIWFSLVSLAIHTGRNWISQTFYRRMLMICAVFLALLGGWFSYDGLQKLLGLFS